MLDQIPEEIDQKNSMSFCWGIGHPEPYPYPRRSRRPTVRGKPSENKVQYPMKLDIPYQSHEPSSLQFHYFLSNGWFFISHGVGNLQIGFSGISALDPNLRVHDG